MRTTLAVSRRLLLALLVFGSLAGGSLTAMAEAANTQTPLPESTGGSSREVAPPSAAPATATIEPTEAPSVQSPQPSVALASDAPPRATVTDSLSLEISGGLSHIVGDTITLTPGGTYPVTSDPIDCEYVLAVRSPLAVGVPFNVAPYVETYTPSVAGECPAWTFRLPNLADMAYFPEGASTRVTVTLVAVTGPDNDLVVAMSPHYDITFAPSSVSVAPMSSLPVVFWQLDRGVAPAGATVHVSLMPLMPDDATSSSCELILNANERRSCAPEFEVVAQSPNAQVDVFMDVSAAYTRSTIYVQGQAGEGE